MNQSRYGTARPADLSAGGRGGPVPIAWLLLVVLAALGCSEPRRPNFVVFLVDTLRPDHLGVYEYLKDTSPNLDRLAEQGVVFDNAYAPAPWTAPSTVSLLTGLIPSEHGTTETVVDSTTRRISFPKNPDVWLPRVFSEQGYTTVGLHTHPYLHRSVSNIYKAFDEYYYPVDRFVDAQEFLVGGGHWTDYIYLDTLYPASEEWLEANYEREFLMYIHVIDVHGPFNQIRVLGEDRQAVEEGLEDGSIAFLQMQRADMHALGNEDSKYLYDGHIRHVDDYLQRLVDKLAELGIREDTYVVFTSDHGEDFGEHGGQWGHGHSVYNTQIRIPLVMLLHRDLAGMRRRVGGHVNTVGLLPTLAELAGIEVAPRIGRRAFTRLLRATAEPRPWEYLSISETSRDGGVDSIMLGRRFKLLTYVGKDKVELFDVLADPGEEVNLAAAPEGDARSELERLTALRRSLFDSFDVEPMEEGELSPEAIEALKALGYVN